MRKKSIIIASIFVILIIIALLILIIYSKFYKKENTIPVDDISFEQNIIQNNIEDEPQNTDDIPTVVEEKPDEITPSQVEEKEDTKVEEKKSSSQTVTPTKTSPNKTETKKETSSKETVKKETTSSSSSTPSTSTTTKPVEEKKESTPQVEQPKTEPKQEPKQETVPEVKVERCTNNHNHSMDVGNSGKWYNSKADAIADYTEKINYWGALWRNFEIEDDEYYKNCPYGYEVWSCMYCGKWTINYYYK